MPNKKVLLVLNSGSSSLKFALFGPQGILTRGVFERLKSKNAQQTAMRQLIQRVNAPQTPDVVAHRIVHGGGMFHRPTRLTPATIKRLKAFIPLAPGHMPANLAGVHRIQQAWPQAKQFGVFDTSLYDHLAQAKKLYAIPLGLSKKYHIRKYGFHGISHAWAFQRAARVIGRAPGRLSAVTIHLGSGDSLTRWRNGHVEDTSMGFSPLEGLTMATRSGDIDPMIPLYLQEHGHFSPKEVLAILQNRSGLVGLTGLSDVRDVLSAAGHQVPHQPKRRWSTQQRHHSELALEMFCYDVQRYLASYMGLLPRCDMIVFTGAVGKNAYLRAEILRGVPAAKKIRTLYVPADEEQAIADAVMGMVH